MGLLASEPYVSSMLDPMSAFIRRGSRGGVTVTASPPEEEDEGGHLRVIGPEAFV
jgi:hypothetical protein